MPNWCSNKIILEGDAENIQKFVNTLKPTPNNHHIVYKAIKLLLAGMVGKRKLTRPVAFCDAFTVKQEDNDFLFFNNQIGLNNTENEAYTQFMELLNTRPDLTPEVCSNVEQLFVASEVRRIVWTDIPKAERKGISKILRRKSFDWFYALSCRARPDLLWTVMDTQVSDEESSNEKPVFDFDNYIDKNLLVEINGFNGRLLNNTPSGYHYNIAHFGTKWNAADGSIFIDTHRVEINVSTAWSPPEPVTEKLIQLFPELSIKHFYSEAGMSFCGYLEGEDGMVTDSRCDDMHWSEEDEDGISEVIAPAYILELTDHGG